MYFMTMLLIDGNDLFPEQPLIQICSLLHCSSCQLNYVHKNFYFIQISKQLLQSCHMSCHVALASRNNELKYALLTCKFQTIRYIICTHTCSIGCHLLPQTTTDYRFSFTQLYQEIMGCLKRPCKTSHLHSSHYTLPL